MLPAGSVARRLFWAAFALGLIVRLAVLSQTSDLGLPIVDERHYVRLATNLLEGHGFAWSPGEPTSIRPPLYPAFLAGLWTITGPSAFQTVRVCQIVMAVLTTLLMFRLGTRVYGRDAGYLAAAVFWLYPSLIYFNFTILSETLFVLLLVAFLLLAVRLVQQPAIWPAVLCGVTLGIAALARSVVWPLPLLLCPLLVMLMPGSFKSRVALSALVLAAYAAVLAPWAVRNTRLQGVTTIVDTMGGINLRMGNYEYTPEDRMWATVDLMKGEKEWSYELTSQNPGVHFTEGQKDKWAQQKAIEYIQSNVGTTVRRDLIKFADLWGIEREFIASVQHGALSPPRWFAIMAGASIVGAYAAVVIMGVAGMWLAAPGRREHVILLLPILFITAIHTLVYGHSRYHIPLMPIFGIYAVGLLSVRRRWWPPNGAAWYGAAICILLLIAIWLRQTVFADAERIRALFGGGHG